MTDHRATSPEATAARTLALAEDMIEWYWTGGNTREGAQGLPPEWIVDTYRQRGVLRALVSLENRPKRTVAVWGPSAAGKSTMLSEFLDQPDERCSALSWSNYPFRFLRDPDQPEVESFNPYNFGADASGCVTRFSLRDGVVDPDHPVEIEFLNRAQILQAIGAGYLAECDPFSPEDGGKVVTLDAEEVRRRLADVDDQQTGEPKREAIEFLVDVIEAISRLMVEHSARYVNLGADSVRPKENVWQGELVKEILEHKVLTSSLKQAQRFGFSLLWDHRAPLNRLFLDLERLLADMTGRFQGRPVLTSLEFAALLVDIDSVNEVFQHRDRSQRRQKIENLVRGIKLSTSGNCVLLTSGSRGERFFTQPQDFGWFQGLVCELTVPLNATFLTSHAPTAANFLRAADLLDVPGVSRFDPTAKPLQVDTAEDVELLGQVLKRGKTGTIINRYAQELRVDLLLLLARGLQPVSKPVQLLAGAKAIWSEMDPSYLPNSQAVVRPPVATIVCLTFMSRLINDIGAVGVDHYDLSKLNGMLSQLDVLANPGVVEFFTTTYPRFPDGQISVAAEKLPAILQSIRDQPWFQRLFLTDAASQSLEAMLRDRDGGVLHLLASLTKHVQTIEREKRVGRRLPEVRTKLLKRLTGAQPQRDLTTDRHRDALIALTRHVNDRLDAAVSDAPGDQDVALDISVHLRRLMEFDPEQFAVPQVHTLRDRRQLRQYIDEQLSHWTSRPMALVALEKLGADEGDRAAILAALRTTIDTNEVADWVTHELGPVNRHNEAKQSRRYVAARCAEFLLGRRGLGNGASDPFAKTFHGTLAAQFDEWEAEDRTPRASPHYVKIIEPILDNLVNIAQQAIATQWKYHPSDAEIERLAQGWI